MRFKDKKFYEDDAAKTEYFATHDSKLIATKTWKVSSTISLDLMCGRRLVLWWLLCIFSMAIPIATVHKKNS